LLQVQHGAQAVGIGVSDGIAGPRPVLGSQLSRSRIAKRRRPDAIGHAGQFIDIVISKRQQVVNVIRHAGQIAHGIISIHRVALGQTPAIRQPVVRVILVFQNRGARGIDLVRHPPKRVITPLRGVVVLIRQADKVAGGAVAIEGEIGERVGLRNLPQAGVVGVI